MIRFGFGKGERSSSGGSISWGSGPALSMELFPRLEDAKLDVSPGALNSEDFMVRLQSAGIVDDILLPDTAVTASAALKAAQSPATSDGTPPSQQQQEQGKIVELTYKLARISTGNEIVPLDEDIRVSSGDWPGDLDAKPVQPVPMPPSLIFPSFASIDTEEVQCSKSPPHLKSPSPSDLQSPECQPMSRPPGMQSALLPSHPPTYCPPASSQRRTVPKPSLTDFNVATADRKKLPTSKKPRKRKPRTRPPRLLDMTRAIEKTDGDVLFGRGGGVNTHSGNIVFRKKALEFLPWYMQSSKEEKEKIANMLVESVKNEGRCFLEKGKDELWHEVIRGEHTKACATFRDLKDGMKKKRIPPVK